MFGAAWREDWRRRTWAGDMPGARFAEEEIEWAPDRRSRALSIELDRPRGINLKLEISLGLAAPTLSWRLHFRNRSARSIRLDRIDLLHLGNPVTFGDTAVPRLRLQTGAQDLAFFSNGWQSWNATGAFGRGELFPRTRLGPLTLPMKLGAASRQPRLRSTFTSEMLGVLGDRVSRVGLLLGFLSQSEAFGGIQVKLAGDSARVRMWADCDGIVVDSGRTFSTDWCGLEFIQIDSDDPLGSYVDRVARVNRARIPKSTPVGWCSWYQFFQAVTENDVAANLAWARQHRAGVPLDVIQLDDGSAAEVGDWKTMSDGFPSGLSALSQRIRKAGFVPGLWLAPFVAKPRAQVLKDHPDWILRNRYGMPVNAGFIWDTFTRALDTTHPAVIDHVEDLVQTAVGEWGFDYLKLDFLYAGALRGRRRDPGRTRAQALRSMLERIRNAAGERTFLLGCGCPLGSGIGIFDAMRIGPDVAPGWEPAYRGVERWLRSETDLPSVRNALRNSITRAPLHRRWWLNDPDCLILRGGRTDADAARQGATSRSDAADTRADDRAEASNPSRLTTEETRTLVTVIALTGGSLFVSDHLPDLPDEQVDLLARLLPPLAGRPRAMDWFDRDHPERLVLPVHGPAGDWMLVALINWRAVPADAGLDLRAALAGAGPVHAVDFWNEEYFFAQGEYLEVKKVPAHGVRLLAIRRPGAPQWLGDTLHVSQGLAVASIQKEPRQLRMDLHLGRRATGKVWLELPSPPARAALDGAALGFSHVEGNVYVCKLSLDGQARLDVEW